MKTLKLASILFFLVFNLHFVFSQNIEKDTISANQYLKIADSLYAVEQYDSALVRYEKVADIYYSYKKDTSFLKKYTEMLVTVAECNRYLYKTQNALLLLDSVYEIYQKKFSEDKKLLKTIYEQKAFTYEMKNEFKKAFSFFEKALSICIDLYGEKHVETAELYVYLGNLYLSLSEYDKALDYYFLSTNILDELGLQDDFTYVRNYLSIGIIYGEKEEFEMSLDYLLIALQKVEEIYGKNSFYSGALYINIASVYVEVGYYKEAFEFYNKGIEIVKGYVGEAHEWVANAYLGLSNLSYEKQEYEKSIKNIFKAIEIYEKIYPQNHISFANAYNNLGNTYVKNGQNQEALKYYYKTTEIKLKIYPEKHIRLSETYSQIAAIEPDQQKKLYYIQKSLFSNLRDFKDTLNYEHVPHLKNYISATRLIIALSQKATFFNNTEKNNIALSSFSEKERLEIALNHLQAADTLISVTRKEIISKNDKINFGEHANDIYQTAIDVCLKLSELSDTIEISNKFNKQAFYFSERNKSSVLLEALACSEALKFSGIPDSVLASEQKISLDITNFKNLKNNAENDSTELYWAKKLFNKKQSYDSLISIFETTYPKYYELKYGDSIVNPEEIQKIIDKKTVVLSYTVSIPDSLIFIIAISKKDLLIKKVKIDTLNFTEMVSDYRFCISDLDVISDEFYLGTHTSVDMYQDLASKFYSLLFPPEIQEFLKGGIFYNIKNLIIIPDGQLATIPFETFLTERYEAEWTNWDNKTYFRDMPYLVKKYNISYTYSATLFEKIAKKNKAKNKNPEFTNLNDWIAFAPVFDDENISGATRSTQKLNQTLGDSTMVARVFMVNGDYIAELPGTLEEVEAIFNLYEKHKKKATIKTHMKANEEFVKSGKLSDYKYIHFATHGFVNTQKPELSGIILAQDTTVKFENYQTIYGNIALQKDGVLFQSEIYNLELNSNLVVLSACETGLGKISSGEGVIGLTRALLYAGTDNIVVSLWQVSDKSTSLLMQNFYKNILQTQKPDRSSRPVRFSKSLRKSKIKMIEKGGINAHPYFWSPFILIGQ